MEHGKNFSLLRELDLTAAQMGAPICDYDGNKVTLIGMSSKWKLVVEKTDGLVGAYEQSYFRMCPLCWLQGRPVYKGDVLYWRGDGGELNSHIADSFRFCGLGWEQVWQETGSVDDQGYVVLRNLFWNDEPVKREGWMTAAGQKLDNEVGANRTIWKTEKLAKENCIAGTKIVHVQWVE